MYISDAALNQAIALLQKSSHPFIGITFLACKASKLPVGNTMRMSLDRATKAHLEKYHKLDPQSEFFFQPFKSNKFWVVQKYPSAGLQAINTQTFGTAFIHPKGSQIWGFEPTYLRAIREVLDNDNSHGLIPLGALAIWIGKDKFWSKSATYEDVVVQFINDFEITDTERSALFEEQLPLQIDSALFSKKAPDQRQLAYNLQLPPDAPSETEGALSSILLTHVGPNDHFLLNFGERLTLIVGDNGLGKSFLLEAAWWAITSNWLNAPAFPFDLTSTSHPKIEYSIRSANGHLLRGASEYDWNQRRWIDAPNQPSVSAISIYGKADGSFAVFDPMRSKMSGWDGLPVGRFDITEIWYGKDSQINGLLRDWSKWQSDNESDEFSILKRILEQLSPEDLGDMVPGLPIRMPGESREIPTIRHSYGNVPVTLTSAGVKRVLSLAYMIIWAWSEHLLLAKQTGSERLKKIVILIDEIEAHLHPKWQRIILPALMVLGRQLSEEVDVQVIAATHSPMVMASVESEFSEDSDTLFHLSLNENSVVLEEMEFQKYGDISAWLTSPIFGLKQARSRSAERAIERAKNIQLNRKPDQSEISNISIELKRQLSPDDPFWSRWIYFAERNGIKI